jgi:inhibitor of cysteine peptidase
MMNFIVRALPPLMRAALMVLVVSTLMAATEPEIATEAQNGKIMVIEKGASVVISLESNPGTGYGWRIGKNDAAVLKPIGAPVFQRSSHDMPGAPGHQLFKFEARAIGNDTIELGYLRPWEKDVPPLKTFSVMVQVK